MKFTPGPWKWVEVMDNRVNPCGYSVLENYEQKYTNDRHGRKICQTPDGTTEENRANAKLIALSPDLLAACEDMYQCLCDIINAAGNDQPYDRDELDKNFGYISGYYSLIRKATE